MDTIPSTQVTVIKGEHIYELTSQSASDIENSLYKNGYKNIFSDKDGVAKIFERPETKWNRKSTVLVIDVQGNCVNSFYLDEL